MSYRIVLKEILGQEFHTDPSVRQLDHLWAECSDYLERTGGDDVIERVDQSTAYPLSEEDKWDVKNAISMTCTSSHWSNFNGVNAADGMMEREMRDQIAAGLMKKFGIKAQRILLSTHRVIQIHDLGDKLASQARVYERCMKNAEKIGNERAHEYFRVKYERALRISKVCERRLKEQS